MSYAIETSGLTKKFGSNYALSDVDLAIPTGSIFGLIGSNGAGKTTIMRILLDVMRQTAGTVKALGVNPRDGGPELRRRIGFLPGELILDGRCTGRYLLNHYASISGPMAPGRIDELAERLDVELDRPIRKLSKGNKQKLGLVQAFMHRPELLVLDEPTSGLDPIVQIAFQQLTLEAQDNGQTILLSSHVLSEVEDIADDVAVLRRGEVATVSTVAALRAQALRRVSATVSGAGIDEVERMLSSVSGLSEQELRSEGEAVALTARLGGSPDAFVKALAAVKVLDVSIEAPNLEDAVLGLYDEMPTRSSYKKGD